MEACHCIVTNLSEFLHYRFYKLILSEIPYIAPKIERFLKPDVRMTKYSAALVLFSIFLLVCPTSCSNQKNLTNGEKQAIENQIIVLLKEGVKPAMLEKNMMDCQLLAGKQISKSQNQWLFFHQCNGDQRTALLEKIQQSEWVLEAYFPPQGATEKSSGTSGKKGKSKPGTD
jgi:hypothetical protein